MRSSRKGRIFVAVLKGKVVRESPEVVWTTGDAFV
jgi:hypothetical protein